MGAGMSMMARKLTPGDRLVIASHNKGKLVEINDLVRPFGVEAVSAGALGISEPEETEPTFAGNAQLKALYSARASGLPALSDDSGLEVAALDGAPGIYSARWAGPSKDFAFAMRRVAGELHARRVWLAPEQPATGPRANFICALCLAWPDGEAQVFEGRIDGRLVWPPRGTRGFGYDPMFLPDPVAIGALGNSQETFGEMDQQAKHAISHRARAFAQFVAACLV
jgi:XTP/dITP diphosphohydrolase